jgi:biopolymer transport protein ExbD
MWTTPAFAQPVAEVSTVDLTGTQRAGDDVTVLVTAEGALSFRGATVRDYELAPLLREAVANNPATRVVVSADPAAPYQSVLLALDLGRESGARGLALVATGLTDAPQPAEDPLFPGAGEVEALDGDLSRKQERALAPKRRKFPQNPYANTASYTAYTLEPGEAKIGLVAVNVGVLPRFQVGTAPVLDVLGAFNANARYNFLHAGPLDLAALGQYYYVPLGALLDSSLSGEGLTVTTRASYAALGGTASLRLAKPWSLHTQLYWAAPSANGDIAFDDLPELLLPGLSLGDSGAVGLAVKADLAVLNLATDLRFNRRDSVYAWLRYPFYGRIRGITSGSIEGVGELENTDVILAYGDTVALADSYSVAVGYQGSWKHIEARIGAGWSAVPGTWLLQAFELGYKFGGETRRRERDIRKGYRRLDDEVEAPAP